MSRQWRDFSAGIEVSFWAWTENGPLRLTVPAQNAVCFVDRDQSLALPAGVQRKPVNLQSTLGTTVDALYFKAQRDLTELQRHPEVGSLLHEADLKPANRYLMERFVNAGFTASGVIVQHQGYVEMQNPKIQSRDVVPSLVLASIDIETRGLTKQLYSIALHSGRISVVLMVNESTQSSGGANAGSADKGNDLCDDFELRFFKTEKDLLEGFFELLQQVDPDVLIGWNVIGFDLDFIARKCEQFNLPLALGRGGEASIILQVGSGASPVKIARVPGRAVLDGIDMLRAAFWSFESFALDYVGQQLLGRGKTISAKNKVEEINSLYQNNKAELARYNIEDCRLVTEIFAKADLISFAVKRAQMTGLPIDKMGGAVQTFDNLYLPRLHRKGYVAAVTPADQNLSSPGGYVLDSVPGLYRNVIVLDFKSLYPSIIRTFLIDPLGLAIAGPDAIAGSSDAVPGFEGAKFSRTEHILPTLIEELWAKRDDAKARNDVALSQAIKIIMNSLYGVLGSSGCRFHNHRLASSITRRGHEIILQSKEFIERAGWQVIYGDTDSLFVLLSEHDSVADTASVGEKIQSDLNNYWRAELKSQYQLESHLEVEFETHFLKFLMPTVRGAHVGVKQVGVNQAGVKQAGVKQASVTHSGALHEASGSKKRYAGQVMSSDGSVEVIFKGLEAVRTDWTLLAREFQRELYSRIFNEEPVDELIRQTTSSLLDGKLDEKLVYRKRLRRKLTDYQRNVPPHVQAARKSSNPQKWISYVLTINGPEPSDERQSELDYQHYIDKQLAPVADGILHFLNSSYHSVVSAQIELF